MKEVDNSISSVKTRIHDVISTEMDIVEMALSSVTGSSGHRPTRVFQKFDRRDFSGDTDNTPLMATSSRTHFKIDQNRIDETRNVKNFEVF